MKKDRLTLGESDLNNVELNHHLRRHTGMGLADAKCAVDSLLESGELVVEVSEALVGDFVAGAHLVGADAESAE